MASLQYLAQLDGDLPITEQSAIGILDQEASRATRKAGQIGRAAIRDAAPEVTGRLKRSHGYSVRKSGFGWLAQMTRKADGWYGRIVEGGRHAGVAASGRHYPAAEANPYVDEAAARSLPAAERVLLAGGDRAAERIAERL